MAFKTPTVLRGTIKVLSPGVNWILTAYFPKVIETPDCLILYGFVKYIVWLCDIIIIIIEPVLRKFIQNEIKWQLYHRRQNNKQDEFYDVLSDNVTRNIVKNIPMTFIQLKSETWPDFGLTQFTRNQSLLWL